MPNNILITGRPGSGKTTLLVSLAERLSDEGFKVAGFVTEEIREGQKRKGFEVRDLQGDSAVLAHEGIKGKIRVSRYGVDIEAFEKVISQALGKETKGAGVLVIDEIGRMETASPLFRSTLLESMDSAVPLLATIHKARDQFSSSLLEREDVSIYEVKPSERDGLLEVIHESLRIMLAEDDVAVKCEGGKRS